MKAGASQQHIDHVFAKVNGLGYRVHPIVGEQRTAIACVGDERGKSRLQALDSLDGVESVVPILKPFKLAGREWKNTRSTITLLSKRYTSLSTGLLLAQPSHLRKAQRVRYSTSKDFTT